MSDNKEITTGTAKETAPVENTEKKPVFSKTIKLLDGTEVTINKLKAGKYYEAQKLYVKWLQNLQALVKSRNVDLEEVAKAAVDSKGKVDTSKITKELEGKMGSSVNELLSQATETGGIKQELIAICLGTTVQELNDNYYPEDLPAIFEAAREINDFNENLKKSVAL